MSDFDWLLWSIAFVSLGGPTAALVLDRAAGLSGRWVWALFGFPGLVALTGVFIYAAADGRPLYELILWGFVGGIAGTVALDFVRLIGVRLGAFPMDMPIMFGAIALGIAPRLQAHVMTEVVKEVSTLPVSEREREMLPRLEATATMSPASRRTVMAAMMHGLGHLSEEQRQGMLQTQMTVLSRLPSERRRALMLTMDEVRGASGDGLRPPLFALPPRGLPKLPMAKFRQFVERALPLTLEETNTPPGRLLAVGYAWHFVNGATLGIAYTLLFGDGSWPLALGWGVFVWAMMMVLMPPMMPLVRFPRWFPVVPLIAHVAMIIPIGFFALEFIDEAAAESSIWGAAALDVISHAFFA